MENTVPNDSIKPREPLSYTDRATAVVNRNPKWAPVLYPLLAASWGIMVGTDIVKSNLRDIADTVTGKTEFDMDNTILTSAVAAGLVGAATGAVGTASIAATSVAQYGLLAQATAVVLGGGVGAIGVGGAVAVTIAIGIPLSVAAITAFAGTVLGSTIGIVGGLALGIKKRIGYGREAKALKMVEAAKALAPSPQSEVSIEGYRVRGYHEDTKVICNTVNNLTKIFGRHGNISSYRPIPEGDISPVFAQQEAAAQLHTVEPKPDFAKEVIAAISELQQAFKRVTAYSPGGQVITRNIPFLERAAKIKAEAQAHIHARSSARNN